MWPARGAESGTTHLFFYYEEGRAKNLNKMYTAMIVFQMW
jgi:hypothetical protein